MTPGERARPTLRSANRPRRRDRQDAGSYLEENALDSASDQTRDRSWLVAAERGFSRSWRSVTDRAWRYSPSDSDPDLIAYEMTIVVEQAGNVLTPGTRRPAETD